MVLLNNNENFSAASGLINAGFLENIYHSVIDEAFLDLGRTITLHLHPIIEQDDAGTQSLPAPQQYNPFFGQTPIPKSTTGHPGVKITHRDVNYEAQIKVGPLKVGMNETGMGDLDDNEAMVTLVVEALPHLEDTIAVSIEGRRYSIEETRPIGFSTRRYIMVKLREIQEQEGPSPDNTIG